MSEVPEPSSRPRQRVQKHVSRACVHCRRRRRKCVKEHAQASCRQCLRDKVVCVLDETPDLRLRHYHQKYKRTLAKVLDTIRLGDAAETDALLSLIQRHASEEEIEDHIDRLPHRSASADRLQDDAPPAATLDSDRAITGYLQELSASAADQYLGRSIWQSANINRARAGASTRLSTARQSISSAPSEDGAHHVSHSGSSARDEVGDKQNSIRPTPNFGNLSMSKSVLTNNFPENIQQRQLQAINGCIEECLPLNLDPESRADRLSSAMLAFRDAARSMIAIGQPVEDVLSMQGLDLELLFRDRLPGDPHSVSTWACEYTKTWTFLPPHVKLASVHYAGSLMRWLILPCRETYALMSKLMRPVDSQLFIPHTGDVDLCHVPCIRATQLQHGGKWVNRVTADSQRCNWIDGEVSSVEERLIQTSKGPVMRKMLSSAFIDFIDDEKNWSLSTSVLTEFPELRGNTPFTRTRQTSAHDCFPAFFIHDLHPMDLYIEKIHLEPGLFHDVNHAQERLLRKPISQIREPPFCKITANSYALV